MNLITPTLYPVYADLRWPPNTGIGIVQTAMLEHKPAHASIIDLQAKGGVGSPFAAWSLHTAQKAALARNQTPGVFYNPGFVPPAKVVMPTVVTVHDLTHLYMYTRWHKAYYNLVFKRLYQQCHSIVCVSEFVRGEFIEWSGMPPERVHVVLNGVSSAFSPDNQAYAAPYPYVLYPGNHRPYKNLERLISAYAASRLSKLGIHLLMTGRDNPLLLAHAARLGVAASVHFIGHVAHAEVPKLYRGALAIAFVSLYEGFGLPIVEAMASGVPVMTSNCTSMPEVAGSACWLVDPYSVDAIAHGLDRLVTDETLRGTLIAKGLVRAQRFNWKRSAQELWAIIDRAAADRPATQPALQRPSSMSVQASSHGA